jgi:hypothetical protein
MELRGSKAVRFPLACNRASPEEVVDFHAAREVTARFKAVVASGLQQPQGPGVGSGNEIGVAVAVVITDSHDTGRTRPNLAASCTSLRVSVPPSVVLGYTHSAVRVAP